MLPAPQLLPALLPSRLRGHRRLYSSRFIALERGSVSPTKRCFCRGMFQCLLNQSLSRKNLRWLLRLLSEESSAFHPSWPQNKAGFSVRCQVAALGSPVWKASDCIFLCHQKDLWAKAKKKKSHDYYEQKREKRWQSLWQSSQKLVEKFRPQKNVNLFSFVHPTGSPHVCLGEYEESMASMTQRKGALFSFTQHELWDSRGSW